ncbi:MAG: hypothetical protein MK082_09590 [Phycisphaerales bacterium]|nr:hypothetical protein [Phycisphaerales bacterium]
MMQPAATGSAALVILCLALSAHGQEDRFEDFIITPETTSTVNRQLGSVIAADEEHLAIGLKDPADGFDGGTLLFMKRPFPGDSWVEIDSIAGPGDGGDEIAAVLAMDDGSLVATSTEFGALPEVTLYRYSSQSDDWTGWTRVLARPVSASEQFGSSLDIDGDLIAVGDPGANRVFIYRFTTDSVGLIDTVLPQSGASQVFGWSVGIDGDWLAVGDPRDGTGRVEVHRLNDGSGSSIHNVLEGDPGELVEGDEFGAVVSMDEGALAVGIHRFGGTPGRIKIYNLVAFEGGESWYFYHQADAVDGIERFPRSIDVEAGVVIAGAPGQFLGSDSGAVMVFRFSGNAWNNSENFRLQGDDSGFQMGDAVALAGTQALVGIPARELGGFPPQLVGGIASYDMDCDGNGVADALEIMLGTTADYDQDGIPDFCEFDEFVLVPFDFETIQSAIDTGGGRVILLEPGTFAEEVVADGVDVDIRAFDPQDLPIWRTSFAAGTAIAIESGDLHLERILFDGNRTAVDAASSELTTIECGFTANGYGMQLLDVSLDATSCVFNGNISIGDGGSAIKADRTDLDLDTCEFRANGGNSSDSDSHLGGAIQIGSGNGNGIRARNCLFAGNQALVRHALLPVADQGQAIGGAVHASLLDGPSFFYQCTFSDNFAEASLERLPGGSSASNNAKCGALWTRIDGRTLGISECIFERNESRALDILGSTGFASEGTLHVAAFASGDVDFTNSTVRDSVCTIAYPDGTITETPRVLAASVKFYSLDSVSIAQSRFERSGYLDCSGIGLADMFIGMTESEFVDCGMADLQKPANAVSCTFIGTRLKISGDVIGCDFESITSDSSSALHFYVQDEPRALINSDFHRISAETVISGPSAALPVNLVGTTICGNATPPFESDLVWNNNGGNMVEGGGNGAMPCPAGGTLSVPGDHATIEDALLAANNEDTILLGSGLFMESIDLRGFGSLTIAGSGAAQTTIDPPSGEAGVLVHGGAVSIRDLTISGASTGVLAHSGTLVINDVVLENNTGSRGAGINLGSGWDETVGDGAEAYLLDTIIRNNSAVGDGGGIFVASDAALVVESSLFDTNTAGGGGGGACIEEGARTVSFAGTDFDFNIASDNGGGLLAGEVELLELVEVDMSGNSAGMFGGGARVVAADLVDCAFVGNTAGEVGGGVRSDGSSFLEGCSFQLNVAGIGGGMASTAIPSFVDGFTACGNIGGDWYGDLREMNGVVLFCSTDCNSNGVPDEEEIDGGLVDDCNDNGIPDVCEDLPDLDGNGIPDECDSASDMKVLVSVLDVVDGLPAGAIDVQGRPLFRSGERTHDMLVLDPDGAGSVVSIRPDGLGGYEAGTTLSGDAFERCCVTPFDVEGMCINNGPAGGASLAFARGDVMISHPTGDTGLFDEELEMYYACDAPAGSGLPSPITDFDLAPETNHLVAVRYVEENEDEGGLARARPSRQGQVLLAAPTASTGSKPSSSRRGSGQGGTGPYPGVDAENAYGLSIRTFSTGTFDGDLNDDLITLHPDENSFSIRNFTGLADYIDPDTDELIPSGATWSEPTFVSTVDAGLGMVVGSFIDFAGDEDDGLDDVAVVVDAPSGPALRIWASTGPNTMVRLGGDYVLIGENFSLGKTRIDSSGTEAILLAQRDPGGNAYLDHGVFDPLDESMEYGWIALGGGEVLAVSSAPVRFGVSDREVIAVLLDVGTGTSMTLVEMSKRPGMLPPSNDECLSAEVVATGSVPFSTVGATTGGSLLPAECQSDGSLQIRNDIWFSWTAPCSGEVSISTCGTADFDTWLVAYAGGCEGAVVGCNDENVDCPDSTSSMTIDAISGETYLIRVGSWSTIGEGEGTLVITCPGTSSDINGDGLVDGADLTLLLGNWGQPGATDLDKDGDTDGADLAQLLGDWGS